MQDGAPKHLCSKSRKKRKLKLPWQVDDCAYEDAFFHGVAVVTCTLPTDAPADDATRMNQSRWRQVAQHVLFLYFWFCPLSYTVDSVDYFSIPTACVCVWLSHLVYLYYTVIGKLAKPSVCATLGQREDMCDLNGESYCQQWVGRIRGT